MSLKRPTSKAPVAAVSTEDDQTLVEAAASGDHRAFETLVSKYERRVFAVALQLTRNGDLAQELTQEVFVRAWKALPRFQGGASFYTWVYRILKNLNIDRHRRNKRRASSEFNDDVGWRVSEVGVGYTARPEVDGVEHTHRGEMHKVLHKALAELSENHREILVLREVQDLSYEEIAEAMEIPKGTVMSRLFHARRKLKEQVVELVGEEAEDELLR
ncbi:MAG: RNA polymerase subunit sigma [Myxococcales bacterium]|nr:RNA polymerase subunit sigma [Myxococcales bacterium]